MDVNVNVTVELGEKTTALINTLTTGQVPKAETRAEAPTIPAPPAPKSAPRAKPEMPKPAETPIAPVPEAPAGLPATSDPKPAPKPASADFDKMDDAEKLETIQAEVTKHAKKGKSADIRFMLAQFDASRASALTPETYDAFYDAITRYGKGEAIETIFPSDLE